MTQDVNSPEAMSGGGAHRPHPQVRFRRMESNPDLPLPERATPHAAGYDVRSAEDEVVLQPGEALDYEELIRYANDRMPYFAVPRFVEFMDGLPKTPTERIQKYVLKQAGVTENTWDREKAGIQIKR